MAGFNTINQLYLPLKDMFRSNQNLLKYIACDQDNPLRQPDIEDIESLFSTRISFRPKAVNTITTKQTVVIVSFVVIPTPNSTKYSNYFLYFDVVTHDDLFITDDEEKPMRIFNIANEIDEYILGAKSKNWAGSCTFGGANPLTSTSEGFSGYRFAYKVSDFHYNYNNKNEVV